MAINRHVVGRIGENQVRPLTLEQTEIAGSATFITEPSMKARLDPKIVAVSVARG
jgi:hypothetical protein